MGPSRVIADPGRKITDPDPGLSYQRKPPVTKTKIVMLRDQAGKDDDIGSSVVTYRAGVEYEVGPSLRRAFVEQIGCASAVTEEPAPPAPAPETSKVDGPKRRK